MMAFRVKQLKRLLTPASDPVVENIETDDLSGEAVEALSHSRSDPVAGNVVLQSFR